MYLLKPTFLAHQNAKWQGQNLSLLAELVAVFAIFWTREICSIFGAASSIRPAISSFEASGSGVSPPFVMKIYLVLLACKAIFSPKIFRQTASNLFFSSIN